VTIVGYSPDDPNGNGYRVLRAGADPYVNGSWTAWSAAPRLGGTSVVTAFGPNGIWAMTHDSILAGMGLKVWRFDGRRFARGRQRLDGMASGLRRLAELRDAARGRRAAAGSARGASGGRAASPSPPTTHASPPAGASCTARSSAAAGAG
jgi:hypothetical protein